MKKHDKKTTKIHIFFLLFFFSILLLPLLSLLPAGLPLTHDGKDHIARIANFYLNLSQGNLIPRWAGLLNWGYGHPILMFLYPLPSYIASFFHFIGFTYIDSAKLVFALSYVLSGLSMFLLVKKMYGTFAGISAGILYTLAPYRLVDLYVRGAIGEHVAFIFPPLICYFLLCLSQKYTYWRLVGVVLAFSALVLSHNAISLMFLPLFFFYFMYLFFITKAKKQFLFSFISMLVLGFGIAAFFWIPAFFEGKYTLRNIVVAGEYINHFVKPLALIYSPWSFDGSGKFSVQIGFIQLACLLIAPLFGFFLYKKKQKDSILLLGLFVYSLCAIFLMLPLSNFIWEKLLLLQNFQFPWRLLSVVVFTTATIGGIVIGQFAIKKQKIIVIVCTVFLVVLQYSFWSANGYLKEPDVFFESIYMGTTDTGESSPLWSVRFMEKTPKNPIEIIEGKGNVVQKERKMTKHIYQTTSEEAIQVKVNTLYFPGWNVSIDGERVASIQYQDRRYHGLMTFPVPSGQHTVMLEFTETKLRFFANVLSLVSLLLLLSIVIVGVKRIQLKK